MSIIIHAACKLNFIDKLNGMKLLINFPETKVFFENFSNPPLFKRTTLFAIQFWRRLLEPLIRGGWIYYHITLKNIASVRKTQCDQCVIVYFFLEDQLAELEIGEDVAIIFEEENLLQDNRDRETFKKALKIIGRNDLATKLEIYMAAGT